MIHQDWGQVRQGETWTTRVSILLRRIDGVVLSEAHGGKPLSRRDRLEESFVPSLNQLLRQYQVED